MRKFISIFMLWMMLLFPINSAYVLGYGTIDTYSYEIQKNNNKLLYIGDSEFSTEMYGFFEITFENEVPEDATFLLNDYLNLDKISCDVAKCKLGTDMVFGDDLIDFYVDVVSSTGEKLNRAYYSGRLIKYTTKPFLKELTETVSVGPGVNAPYNIKTTSSDIAFLNINGEFLTLDVDGEGTGVYSYDLEIPFNKISGDSSFEISFVDKYGLESNKRILEVLIDDEAPQLGFGIDSVTDSAIQGLFVKSGTKYISVQNKKQFTIENPKSIIFAACFNDENSISGVGDFSSLGGFSVVNGICEKDENNLCDSGETLCEFQTSIREDVTCDSNGCSKPVSITVKDVYGTEAVYTFSGANGIDPMFFSNEVVELTPLFFKINDMPGYTYGYSSDFHFVGGDKNSMMVRFPKTDKITKVQATSFAIKNVLGVTAKTGGYFDFTKEDVITDFDNDYFYLNHFTINPECEGFGSCNIKIRIEDNLGNYKEFLIGQEFAQHIDLVKPELVRVDVDPLGTSTFSTLGNDFFYIGDEANAVVRIYVSEADSLLDSTKSSLNSVPADYCDLSSDLKFCEFKGFDAKDLNVLQTMEFVITDMAGNSLSGKLGDLGDLKLIQDKEDPDVLITKVSYYSADGRDLSSFVADGEFVRGNTRDHVVVNFNVTESNSGYGKTIVNISQLNPEEDYTDDVICTLNEDKLIYECEVDFLVDVRTSGEKQVKFTVYDKAGNVNEKISIKTDASLLKNQASLPIIVAIEEDNLELDCLDNNAKEKQLVQRIGQSQFWHRPKGLKAEFSLGVKPDSACKGKDMDLYLAEAVNCVANIADYEEDLAFIPQRSINYDNTNNNFNFALEIYLKETADRSEEFFNKTEFTLTCSFNAYYKKDNVISNPIGEQVNLTQKFVFVDDKEQVPGMDYSDEIRSIEQKFADRDNRTGWWAAIDAIEGVVDMASVICKVGKTVKSVVSVTDGVGAGLYIVGYVYKPLDSLKKIGGYIMGAGDFTRRWFLGGENLPKSSPGRFLAWEGDTYGLGKIACYLSNCGEAPTPKTKFGNFRESNPVCEYAKNGIYNSVGSKTGGIDDGKKLEVTKSATYASLSNGDAAKKSWFAAASCLCIPALTYKFKQYMQYNCKKAFCLKYETVYGYGVTPDVCTLDYKSNMCYFGIGADLDMLASGVGINQILKGWKTMVSNPQASMYAGLKAGMTPFSYEDGQVKFRCSGEKPNRNCNTGVFTYCANELGFGKGYNNLKSSIKAVSNPVQAGVAFASCSVASANEFPGAIFTALASVFNMVEEVIYWSQVEDIGELFYQDVEFDYCDALVGKHPKRPWGWSSISEEELKEIKQGSGAGLDYFSKLYDTVNGVPLTQRPDKPKDNDIDTNKEDNKNKDEGKEEKSDPKKFVPKDQIDFINSYVQIHCKDCSVEKENNQYYLEYEDRRVTYKFKINEDKNSLQWISTNGNDGLDKDGKYISKDKAYFNFQGQMLNENGIADKDTTFNIFGSVGTLKNALSDSAYEKQIKADKTNFEQEQKELAEKEKSDNELSKNEKKQQEKAEEEAILKNLNDQLIDDCEGCKISKHEDGDYILNVPGKDDPFIAGNGDISYTLSFDDGGKINDVKNSEGKSVFEEGKFIGSLASYNDKLNDLKLDKTIENNPSKKVVSNLNSLVESDSVATVNKKGEEEKVPEEPIDALGKILDNKNINYDNLKYDDYGNLVVFPHGDNYGIVFLETGKVKLAVKNGKDIETYGIESLQDNDDLMYMTETLIKDLKLKNNEQVKVAAGEGKKAIIQGRKLEAAFKALEAMGSNVEERDIAFANFVNGGSEQGWFKDVNEKEMGIEQVAWRDALNNGVGGAFCRAAVAHDKGANSDDSGDFTKYVLNKYGDLTSGSNDNAEMFQSAKFSFFMIEYSDGDHGIDYVDNGIRYYRFRYDIVPYEKEINYTISFVYDKIGKKAMFTDEVNVSNTKNFDTFFNITDESKNGYIKEVCFKFNNPPIKGIVGQSYGNQDEYCEKTIDFGKLEAPVISSNGIEDGKVPEDQGVIEGNCNDHEEIDNIFGSC